MDSAKVRPESEEREIFREFNEMEAIVRSIRAGLEPVILDVPRPTGTAQANSPVQQTQLMMRARSLKSMLLGLAQDIVL